MNALPQRIVLFGVSKSGKSTLGNYLKHHFGHQNAAFADPLKQACKLIFGFSDEHLYGPSEARDARYEAFEFSGWCFDCGIDCEGPERHLHHLYTSNRDALVAIVEAHRDVADYWRCPSCNTAYPKFVTVRTALQTLGTAWGRQLVHNLWAKACFAPMNPSLSYVVTDGRFRTELAASRAARACSVLLLRALSESTSSHQSEREVREMAQHPHCFDIVLDNTTGTAEENAQKLVVRLSALGILSNDHIDFRGYPDLTAKRSA